MGGLWDEVSFAIASEKEADSAIHVASFDLRGMEVLGEVEIWDAVAIELVDEETKGGCELCEARERCEGEVALTIVEEDAGL